MVASCLDMLLVEVVGVIFHLPHCCIHMQSSLTCTLLTCTLACSCTCVDVENVVAVCMYNYITSVYVCISCIQ